MPNMAQKMTEAMKSLPKFDAESLATSKYYKGGFDPKMNKREAALILGISPIASKQKVQFFIIYLNKKITKILLISDKRCSQENYVAESSR